MNTHKNILQGLYISHSNIYKSEELLTLKLYQDKLFFLTLQAINRNKSFKIRINPIYLCELTSNSINNKTPLILDILSLENYRQYIMFSNEESHKIYNYLTSYFI